MDWENIENHIEESDEDVRLVDLDVQHLDEAGGFYVEPDFEPTPIPDSLLFSTFKTGLAGLALFLLSLFFVISGVAKWHLLVFGFIALLVGGFSSLYKYYDLKDGEHMAIEGYVHSTDKKKTFGLKNSRTYYLIKVEEINGNGFFNFNYFGKHAPSDGDPVTLYVLKDQPIEDSEEGFFIPKYMGVRFSIEPKDEPDNEPDDEFIDE